MTEHAILSVVRLPYTGVYPCYRYEVHLDSSKMVDIRNRRGVPTGQTEPDPEFLTSYDISSRPLQGGDPALSGEVMHDALETMIAAGKRHLMDLGKILPETGEDDPDLDALKALAGL